MTAADIIGIFVGIAVLVWAVALLWRQYWHGEFGIDELDELGPDRRGRW